MQAGGWAGAHWQVPEQQHAGSPEQSTQASAPPQHPPQPTLVPEKTQATRSRGYTLLSTRSQQQATAARSPHKRGHEGRAARAVCPPQTRPCRPILCLLAAPIGSRLTKQGSPAMILQERAGARLGPAGAQQAEHAHMHEKSRARE